MNILNIFRNPYVAIIGSLTSIVALPLAVYFYFSSLEKTDLTYYVHPARAELISSDSNKNFVIFYNKTPVKAEVTAVTIAFWNAGKKAIRKTDILKPLEFKLNNKSPILNVKMINKSREVVEINIDESKKKEGMVIVDWNVLEKNDGASIQIIYAGGFAEPVVAEAVVIGQSSPTKVEYPGSIKSADEQYSDYQKQDRKFGLASLLFGLFMLFVFFVQEAYVTMKRRDRETGKWKWDFNKSDIIKYSQALLFIGLGIYLLFLKVAPFPPFGF